GSCRDRRGGVIRHLRSPAPMGEADRLRQELRVLRILALVAGEGRQRIRVEALRLEQPEQAQDRVPVAAVVADGLAVLLDGPVVVAELLGRHACEPARDAVVRPYAQPFLERLERLAGLPARAQPAA